MCYIWFPHDLKKNSLDITGKKICETHFKRNENNHFLKRFITADEKWIVHNKINGKRSWPKYDEPVQTELKAEFNQIKVRLSSWWDYKNVAYASKQR